MDSDLARQLKEAGFKTLTGFPVSNSGDGLYYPTLSELIEACGKDFEMLVQRNAGQCWGAVGGVHGDVRGSTPEEAVARLWLALHK
jgi:hypothetical protein